MNCFRLLFVLVVFETGCEYTFCKRFFNVVFRFSDDSYATVRLWYGARFRLRNAAAPFFFLLILSGQGLSSRAEPEVYETSRVQRMFR